jgi:PAS domain S-box-containing protein
MGTRSSDAPADPTRAILDGASSAILSCDASGVVTYANAAYARLSHADDAVGRPFVSLCATASEVEHALHATAVDGSWSGELRLLRADGTTRSTWFSGTRCAAESAVAMFVEAPRPAHREWRASSIPPQALAWSEQHLREITETMDTVVWLADPNHARVIYVSPSFERVWGISRDELLADPRRWLETVHPDDAERVREVFERSPTDHAQQYRIVRPDGSVRWVDVHVRPVLGARGAVVRIVGTAEDITDERGAEVQRREMSRRLETSLQEKNVLLREVHHRVKNNLQVIASLLYLESAGTQDEAVRRVLAVCRDRVVSMALVHEALYESTDLARVDIGTYLRRLVSGLRATWGAGIDLTVECQVTAPPLDIETALPCGLIVTELVTNAFKYAFVGRPTGTVHVQLRRDTTEIQLVVADDGIGLPAAIDVHRPRTIGMRLVHALAGQLGGELEVVRHAGTRIGISFPATEPR